MHDPAAGQPRHLGEARRHIERMRRYRQLPVDQPAQKADLLLGRDPQRREDPRAVQAVVVAGIAGHVLVAVIELPHVRPEALGAERMRDPLRIPHHRILHPPRRIGRRMPCLTAPVRIARLERQRRRVRIPENAGVIAHQAQRNLEGGGRRDTLAALPLLHDGPTGCGIGHQRAKRPGVRKRCQCGQQRARRAQAKVLHGSISSE